MRTTVILSLVLILVTCHGCKKQDPPNPYPKFSADVANAWMQMQIRLTRSTIGYNSVVSDRSFAYAGICLYESMAPAVPGGRSLLSQIGGVALSASKSSDQYYWPASVNAAMAMLTKSFFETTSQANMGSIDSLETAFSSRFQSEGDAGKIQSGVEYGRQVAAAIFNWSKDDGAHQAYAHLTDPTFKAPVGPGLWIPTPAAYAAPVHPHWGENRSFIANIANSTLAAPPIPYSTAPNSAYYAMVNELYTISLTLTREDSTMAKFWGDQPGNLNVPAHATNILAQLINIENFDLAAAVQAYALHGIAMNDASISIFKTKYLYNQLRPITYIRNTMGYETWNPVIPTPPHAEYPAAHAGISAASAVVLEKFFGKNYSFTDHSYDGLYGARTYNSFDAYAKEAGRSRLLAGIHYSPSIAIALIQGRQVGEQVILLRVH